MFRSCSQKISRVLLQNGLIDSTRIDVYVFGIETVLLRILHFGTMLLLGALLGKLAETILFMILYSLLRAYAGGYHADTKVRCYATTWAIMLLVLLVAHVSPQQLLPSSSVVLFLAASGVIFWLAPTDNAKRRLDNAEKRRYKRLTVTILAGYDLVALTLYALGCYYANMIFMSVLVTCVMIFCEKLKDAMHHHEG